jgi:RNA polymerase sigma-70 factor (ECF subfamily)
MATNALATTPTAATAVAGASCTAGADEFSTHVLCHRQELYACAMRYTREPGDAEDLVQETLLRAFDAWPRFLPGSNVRAWLFRILTNSFINHYRRRKRHRRFATESPDEAVSALYGADRAHAAASPAAALCEATLSDEVIAALAALAADHREVVVLADLGGVRYRDIAHRLGLPIGTVMSRLFRARRQLEAQLSAFAAADYGIQRAALGAAELPGAL